MAETPCSLPSTNKFKTLTDSIEKEFHKSQPTDAYLQAKQDIIEIIKRTAKTTKIGKNYPDLNIWLQGSSVNGFETKMSDADMVLITGDFWQNTSLNENQKSSQSVFSAPKLTSNKLPKKLKLGHKIDSSDQICLMPTMSFLDVKSIPPSLPE